MRIKTLTILQMKSLQQVIFFLCMFTLTAVGQKPEKASGKFQLRIESTMTKEEAKARARELAIIDAIQSVYGTYAEQQTDIRVYQGRESFSIIGNTRVLGEWVETTNETFTEEIRPVKENGQTTYETWITCTIAGKARKATPKAAIRYQTLNCLQMQCRTVEFYSDESLYLYFESPVNGYLSVFLEDDQQVYRLFPYAGMRTEEQSAVAVEGDRSYILFSNEPGMNAFGSKADELLLYTTKAEEHNTLYILFSEKPFLKPGLTGIQTLDIEGKEIIVPRSLGKVAFQQWLATNRALDQTFLVANVHISIISR